MKFLDKFVDNILKVENKFTSSVKQKRYFFAFLMISLFLMIYIVSSITPFIADDFGFASDIRDNMYSIKDFFKLLKNHYMYSNGRVISMFWIYLFMVLGKTVFNFVNAFVYVFMTLLVYMICCGLDGIKKPKIFIYILINILIWFLVPDYGQVVFWLSGACNYLWVSIPILLMLFIDNML